MAKRRLYLEGLKYMLCHTAQSNQFANKDTDPNDFFFKMSVSTKLLNLLIVYNEQFFVLSWFPTDL